MCIRDSDNGGGSPNITVASVRSEYDERYFGGSQKWNAVAPRPTTSPWVADRGGADDQIHIIVLDGDGKLTGTPGSLLEKHLNVSKASDARSPQGDNIYYKDVIKNFSQYIYWGSHETTEIYDKDPNATGTWGLSGINREFDLIKKDTALNNIDDPSGLNPLSVPLVGTINQASLHYSLQGGVDGYTISRPDILGAYDLFNDAETVDLDLSLIHI